MYTRLRDIRQENNVSQQKIAKILGVTQTTYGRMERQDIPFDVQHMKKVAQYFDVNIDYLIGASDKRRKFGE